MLPPSQSVAVVSEEPDRVTTGGVAKIHKYDLGKKEDKEQKGRAKQSKNRQVGTKNKD